MKYLSKLMSMLLIGGMLFTIGCTDYDSDIKNLQDRVDEVENELQKEMDDRINALDADLDAVETALKGLIKEANDKIAANETAINNLKSVDAEHEKAIKEAKDAIAAAVERIATLETKLAALTKELEDLEGKHDADIEAVRAELAKEIADLNTAILAEIATVNTAIADAVGRITTNEGDIAALKKADEEFQKAIDELKGVDSTLAGAIAENTGKIAENTGKIGDNTEAIAENAKAIEGLTTANEELAKRVTTAEDAIALAVENIGKNAEAIAKNTTDIAKNASDIQDNAKNIAANTGLIQANADAIAKLTTDLVSLTDKFTAFETETKAAIADLQTRVDAAEKDIDNLEKSVEEINALNKQQDELLEKHGKDLENLNENLDSLSHKLQEVNEYTENLYKQLVEVEKHLESVIAQLGEEFGEHVKEYNGFKTKVDAQFLEAFGKIAANATAIAALEAKHDAEVKALVAQDTAILNTLEQHVAWLVELEESIATNAANIAANKGLIEALTKRVEANETAIKTLNQWVGNLETDFKQYMEDTNAALANLEAAIAQALVDAKAYAEQVAQEKATEAQIAAVAISKEYTDKLVNALNEELAKIKGDIEDLKKKDEELAKSIADYKEEMAKVIAGLNARLEEILGRVQSIVFVPEYSDGKGTIDYAMAGDTLVETRSTMVYQVYPAECAALIANAPVENVTFNIEGLKTRGAEAQFNVVALKGETNGRLYVTFETRNLGADFYAGKMEYAASLVLTTELENLSTVYTNVVPTKTPEQISMAIMYGDKEIKGSYNPASEKNLAYQFEYTDTETIEEVLPEHYVAFTVAGKTYKGIKELNAAGYALELNCANYIHREYNEELGTLPFEVADADNDGILEVKVSKIDGTLIYNIVKVGYTYTAGTLKSTAYSDFVTVPVQADINFEAVSANWTYSKDANVDANKSGAYTRVLPLTVVNHNLPEDVKSVAEVMALTPNSVKVTLNGEETSVAAKLIAKGEEMFLEIANFAWDKAYDIEAKYSVMKNGLPVVEATAKIAFNTTDRNREPITINFDPADAKFAANLQLTNEISDNMDVAYELLVFGNENYDIDCEKYLAENFVVDYTYVDALIADGKKINVLESFNTMLAIDGVNNGKNIYTAFCYADFNFVPAQVEYTKTVTTWYGQEFIINKVLNFEFPVYDFDHNPLYVYGTQGNHYSQVQPHYNWETSQQVDDLMLFDVDKVQLPVAFHVVDADGKKLTAEQMNNLKLTIDFVIEDNEHPGIYIDPTTMFLSYYGAKDQVNVKGRIFINNDNGTRYAVPTSFDEGKYESYHVRKFNPLTTPASIAPESKPVTITVDNAILYDYASTDGKLNLWQYIEMFDKRGYPVVGANGWVIGTGANGFSNGMNVSSESLYRIKHSWNNSEDHLPAHIADVININDGMLSFDNRAQLELTGPFTVPVTLTITNIWMESYDVTVFVQFKPVEKQN